MTVPVQFATCANYTMISKGTISVDAEAGKGVADQTDMGNINESNANFKTASEVRAGFGGKCS